MQHGWVWLSPRIMLLFSVNTIAVGNGKRGRGRKNWTLASAGVIYETYINRNGTYKWVL